MTNAKAISLAPKLEARFKSLDKKMNLLFEELKVYSEAQLNRKPTPDKWSVIQVMHHLLLAERSSLSYLQKKLSFNPELKRTGVGTRFRSMLVWASLNAPIKFKAPDAVSGENLPQEAGFWDTIKQWQAQRKELKTFLSKLPPSRLKEEIYKHPFAGRLGAYGMLDFFEWHFDRHHKQIRRIVKDYSKQI